MGTQAFWKIIERQELIGVAALIIIGVVLGALTPGKKSDGRASVAGG